MQTMKKIGFKEPTNVEAFLAVGRLEDKKVVTKNQSGILFIAWRCLYAGIIANRMDGERLVLKNIYIRTLNMTITRLTYYGEKWLKWVRKNRYTGKKHKIPKQHQNKQIIKQNTSGIYTIHHELYSELKRLKAI